MATDTAGNSARVDPRQVLNTIKRTVLFGDDDATAMPIGNQPSGNPLPQDAFVVKLMVDVRTAFNAATTNILLIGTNSATFTNMCATGDVDLATIGVYEVTRGYGRSLFNSADTGVYAIYAQGGTTATAGNAVITITYEGGHNS